MAGIYIHIPFCVRKCVYCDFYSLGVRKAPWEEFVQALSQELRIRLPELRGESVTTIYIGGGTPSLMPAGEFGSLSGELRQSVDFSRVEEFTVEVNPDDVSPELVDRLLEA